MPATPFAALRNRNFRLFIAGQFVSLCGTWVQTVAVGWLALELTDSPFKVGLVTTIGSLPVLLFTLYGGVLADRVDRRRALLWLKSLFLVDALALGLLTAFGVITMPWIYALAFASGMVSAFEIPIRQSFLIEMVGKSDTMNAVALNSSAFNLSRVIGPAVAGTILASAGTAACFLINAASAIAVLVSLAKIRSDGMAGGGRLPRRAPLAEGVRHVLAEPWSRSLVVVTACFTIFGASFVAVLPVFARDVLNTGAGGYGALTSAFGIGAAAGALSVAAMGHRFPRERVVLLAGTAFATAVLLVGAARVFPLAFVLLLVAGLAAALNAILTNTILQTTAPDHLRGQVVGLYSFIVVGMAPLGALQAGWFAEHLGAGPAVMLGGAACLVVAAGAWWKLGRGHPAPGSGEDAFAGGVPRPDGQQSPVADLLPPAHS
ncbi:MAG: MFS transporter [Gemmatimonadales bacterium]